MESIHAQLRRELRSISSSRLIVALVLLAVAGGSYVFASDYLSFGALAAVLSLGLSIGVLAGRPYRWAAVLLAIWLLLPAVTG
jgi:hypothetical protein